MEIAVVESPPDAVEADVLAFALGTPVQLSGAAAELDRKLGGRIARLIEDGELKGSSGSLTVVHTASELTARRVAVAGLGEQRRVDADSLRTAASRVAARLAGVGQGTVAWVMGDGLPLGESEQARAIVDGTVLAAYDPGRWKTNEEKRAPVRRLLLCGPAAQGVGEAARRAGVVAEWANRCRDLVNAPPNELTPASLADRAAEIASSVPHLSASALGPDEIAAAGMGAFSAVAHGSENPPRLITLAYDSPDPRRSELTLGLVGKAITFDTGGLSLKPAGSMDGMKADMAGGAAVLCALGAVAELGVPLRVRGFVGAAENMPSGRAYRPGDIVTAKNGKTIEITNTDAEGRLVLADVLCYAHEQGATHVVDLATLTGAMVVALGDFYAGVFGNDESWIAEVRAAGEAGGDHVWPFPLHETYRRHIRSIFADMKNASDLRQAGPVYAARFLQEFVGEGPWAHLDIAGTAFLERGRGDYYTEKGATGYGVRLLATLAERLAT